MKKYLLVLLIFLAGCQLAMKYPELPEVEKVPALPALYKQRPIAFEKAVIDLPRGQTYIAYPYWRWSFDNVDIGVFGACKLRQLVLYHTWEEKLTHYIENVLRFIL